ncbi:hypothetical protein EK21DRAFT_94684 [Setomelanomma holmii]|uniref:Uncharacterized protein n=1 Tax=Setomelanomma holmii TaxID=210430 RepID=A0A9P4LFY4_9PLEO|nr:hypothetical protein EK21DRAFT_94684 [Setomelanomma holmii]
MPPTQAATSSQTTSHFFTLPREIRDNIYHYVFQTHRFIHCAFPPQLSSMTTTTFPVPGQIRDFQLRYRLPDTTSRRHSECSLTDYSGTQSTWLLTSRTLMLEAVAQFLRNCEWTCTANGLMVHTPDPRLIYADKRHWTTRLPVEARCVTEMELYVGNLANWEDPMHHYGVDSHPDLVLIAAKMREHKIELERMRFVGHSYSFYRGPRGALCNGQVGNMFRNLRSMFDGVEVRKWEFGIEDYPNTKYWALSGWDEQRDVLEMVVYKRRVRVKRPDPPPAQDLERLLPHGWVLKMEVCGRKECDGCYPAEKETWRTVEV